MSKHAFVAAVAGTVLVLDQLTKWWIRRTLEVGDAITVIPSHFHIVHARNTGGAFSFLAGADAAFRVPFFLIATMIAIGVLVYFLRQVQPHQRVLLFALAGLLGGALGNLIDRVALGSVTDFLDVHWRHHHWPAFNVADSFISIGVVILLVHSLLPLERREHESTHRAQ